MMRAVWEGNAMLKALGEKVLDLMVVGPARRVAILRRALSHVAQRVPVGLTASRARQMRYDSMRETFLTSGHRSKYDWSLRVKILDRLERIDREVNILSTPTDGLFLAEAALSLDCDGVFVECGAFNGGSTSKLSIMAKTVGRKLLVFDSFEGLPNIDPHEAHDLHVRKGSPRDWTAGRFSAPLDLVKETVRKYGEPDSCEFYRGWFKDTLSDATLPSRIALAFTDVDLATSARDCLTAIWPRLSPGGVFFSHDIAFVKVLQAFTDPELWNDVLRQPMPIIFGAGYGLCETSPNLGFLAKCDDDQLPGLLSRSILKP
jgi:O-methyltransferase